MPIGRLGSLFYPLFHGKLVSELIIVFHPLITSTMAKIDGDARKTNV
jgi:hypothetical protein